MMRLTELEREVLLKATEGDERVFRALRQQVEEVRVTRREHSGVGFVVDLDVDRSVPPTAEARDFAISDLAAKIGGLERGAGFVVFVSDGYLAALEGFTYDEPWPPEPIIYSVLVAEPRLPLVTS